MSSKTQLRRHPNAPQLVTGVINSDGSVKLNWDAVLKAKAYLIHYADANKTDPHDAKYMGYTETNSWTLATANVPTLVTGDKIYFYVQAYNVVAPSGTTEIGKAAALHDADNITGSAWSAPTILTKN
ncbi:MAG: fibronectin type III domain-containing protein [Lactococcus lactis]|jgi:hypothetical protein|nr:fibronectin type III domain-containing protein [Lactococcus lactis]